MKMKYFLRKTWPYLLALVVALVIILIDCFAGAPEMTAEETIEEYARGLVESSEIMVNDNIYHGSYTSEEITSLPEGFELAGTLKDIVPEGELTENLTSNSISEGYEIYASSSDPSKIYLRVTQDGDEFQTYVEYLLGRIENTEPSVVIE